MALSAPVPSRMCHFGVVVECPVGTECLRQAQDGEHVVGSDSWDIYGSECAGGQGLDGDLAILSGIGDIESSELHTAVLSLGPAVVLAVYALMEENVVVGGRGRVVVDVELNAGGSGVVVVQLHQCDVLVCLDFEPVGLRATGVLGLDSPLVVRGVVEDPRVLRRAEGDSDPVGVESRRWLISNVGVDHMCTPGP